MEDGGRRVLSSRWMRISVGGRIRGLMATVISTRLRLYVEMTGAETEPESGELPPLAPAMVAPGIGRNKYSSHGTVPLNSSAFPLPVWVPRKAGVRGAVVCGAPALIPTPSVLCRRTWCKQRSAMRWY